MTTDAELDEKLARLRDRIQARRGEVRAHLELRPELLELAEAAREVFGAKLVYVRVGDFEQGDRGAFDQQGQPYDFDLRADDAASRSVRTDAAAARPADEPYRGRTTGGKRRTRKAAASGAGRRDPMAWLDRS